MRYLDNRCSRTVSAATALSRSTRVAIPFFVAIPNRQKKENLNASKPSDQSKGSGGNIGCRDKNLYMVSKGFPNVVT